MRRLFISYARENKRDVDQLVEHLGLMGYETWVDFRLRGGQDWWEEILRRIANTDVFIAVLSGAALNSTACRRELEWAEALGRPILPVSVEPLPAALPRHFARRQIIDYSAPEQRQRAALMLQGGLGSVEPAAPLPNPLPEAPQAPLSYLTDLIDLVSQTTALDREQQHDVLRRLEGAIRSVDPEERRGGHDVLERFASRADLDTDVDPVIDRLRHSNRELSRVSNEDEDAAMERAVVEVLKEDGESSPIEDGDAAMERLDPDPTDPVGFPAQSAYSTAVAEPFSRGGLVVDRLQFRVGGEPLLDDISLTARPGTLTAIIGPSGAGKSTLSRVIVGAAHPTKGTVFFEGHDIHAEYASLRSRIGMVTQEDVVHRQLTVNQELGYAAELRLPPDTAKEDRRQLIAEILEELEMTRYADTRLDLLSGSQLKRVSTAMELLTGPSLLVLDEPTAGLDPALDRQVMTMLRQLADAGRVVLVATNTLTYLDVCDQVLLLATGGKTAFCGPPYQIGPDMGTTNWADIFSIVASDPGRAHARYLLQTNPPQPQEEDPTDLGGPLHRSPIRQFSAIARRQLRLTVADRGHFAFLALLPFVMGALSVLIASPEPRQILVLLIIGAVFMGIALTVGDPIDVRTIFLREQAVGLSTNAYLLAKVVVICGFAVVGSMIMTAIVDIIERLPTDDAAALTLVGPANLNGKIELFAAVAATCVASALLGQLLSALARSNTQLLMLLMVAIVAQILLSGGIFVLADRALVDQLSWLMPARWGFAAAASTIDLNTLGPSRFSSNDSHWNHTAGTWLFDMCVLAILSAVYAGLVWWRIRLRRR